MIVVNRKGHIVFQLEIFRGGWKIKIRFNVKGVFFLLGNVQWWRSNLVVVELLRRKYFLPFVDVRVTKRKRDAIVESIDLSCVLNNSMQTHKLYKKNHPCLIFTLAVYPQ